MSALSQLIKLIGKVLCVLFCLVVFEGARADTTFALGPSLAIPVCQGCSVTSGGAHSCFEAGAGEPGNSSCKITNDPNTGKERCQFDGSSCGGSAALLPVDGVAVLAAHGMFILGHPSAGTAIGPDGFGRLCSGVIVDEGDHDDAGRLEIVL